MFYHAVLMKLSNTDPTTLARIAHYESRILAELAYVRDYRFGRNVASRSDGFDWAVVATFDSSADHERYQVSDVHQEMKAFMAQYITDLVVCDIDSRKGRDNHDR
jgi:hypothetical protein